MDNLKTKFGKRKVKKEDKTSLVQNIFTEVSIKYDLMNDIMSFGAHRLWKKRLIEMMHIQRNDSIIDVGSGTGYLINLILKILRGESQPKIYHYIFKRILTFLRSDSQAKNFSLVY